MLHPDYFGLPPESVLQPPEYFGQCPGCDRPDGGTKCAGSGQEWPFAKFAKDRGWGGPCAADGLSGFGLRVALDKAVTGVGDGEMADKRMSVALERIMPWGGTMAGPNPRVSGLQNVGFVFFAAAQPRLT